MYRFFSKPKLKYIFEQLPNDAAVIIDLTKAEFIDQDIIDTINEFDMSALERNIQVTVKKSTYNESHKLVGNDQINISDSAH